MTPGDSPLSSITRPPAMSVSELNQRVKSLLEGHFDEVNITGEIGDFTAAGSGHWYFTLKDADAQVRCAMFKGANARIRFKPNRSDLVQIRARVSLYTNRGEFQLIAQHMQAAGDGALQLAFERLRDKLKAEGLFAAERKQAVPDAARQIGVITSASGAALHDILSVLARRSPMTRVFVFPSPVQGEDAPTALIAAIKQANRLQTSGDLELDAIIIGRGGGSAEDLWAFNDESLARAIADSALPVISAVGHEVDFSISDFVADERAATPSAAAELVSLDQEEWQQRLDEARRTLHQRMQRRLREQHIAIGHLSRRLRHPGSSVSQQRSLLETRHQQLRSHLNNKMASFRQRHGHLTDRLQNQHPRTTIRKQRDSIGRYRRSAQIAMQTVLSTQKREWQTQAALLDTLGPQNTLARGYAIVTDSNGAILRSAGTSEPGNSLTIQLARGNLKADVTAVEMPGPPQDE